MYVASKKQGKATNLLRLPEVHSVVCGLVGKCAEGPETDTELLHRLSGEQLVLQRLGQEDQDRSKGNHAFADLS